MWIPLINSVLEDIDWNVLNNKTSGISFLTVYYFFHVGKMLRHAKKSLVLSGKVLKSCHLSLVRFYKICLLNISCAKDNSLRVFI